VNVLQPSYRHTRNKELPHDWSRRGLDWIDAMDCIRHQFLVLLFYMAEKEAQWQQCT
jgi:hypothetical protein